MPQIACRPLSAGGRLVTLMPHPVHPPESAMTTAHTPADSERWLDWLAALALSH